MLLAQARCKLLSSNRLLTQAHFKLLRSSKYLLRSFATYDPHLKQYSSTFPSIPGPPYAFNLSQLITKSWHLHLDKSCYIDEDSALTFGETLKIRSKLSSFLSSSSSTSTVAAIMSNSPFYLPLTLACVDSNRILSPINPAYTISEVESQIKVSNSALAITDSPQIYSSLLESGHDVILLTAEFLDSLVITPTAISTTISTPNTNSTTALLPFSSGTTGLPKGTMLSQDNLIANLLQLEAIEGDVVKSANSIISPLPEFHIYAFLVAMLFPAMLGTTTISLQKFTLEGFCELVETHKPSRAYLVPPIILNLAKETNTTDKYDLTSLTSVTSAAAPLSLEITNEFNTKFKVSERSEILRASLVKMLRGKLLNNCCSVGAELDNSQAGLGHDRALPGGNLLPRQ